MFIQIVFDNGDMIVGLLEDNVPEQVRAHLGAEAIVMLLKAAILVEDEFVPVKETAVAVYLRRAIQVDVIEQ